MALASGTTGCLALSPPRRQAPTVRMVREPAPGAANAGPAGATGEIRGTSASWVPTAERGASAPLPPDVLARALDAAVRSGRDAYLLPGVAVVLSRRQGPSFCRGYGVAALPPEAPTPVDVHTAFASTWPAGAAAPLARPSSARRASGHVVDLAAGAVAPLRPGPQGGGQATAWSSAQDWAERLGHLWRGAQGGPAAAAVVVLSNDVAPWQRRYDAPGFVTELAAWPTRGVAVAVLVNAGAGPGVEALLAQVHGVVLDYTPAP